MGLDDGSKLIFKSSDGEEFLVEKTVAMESQVIRKMIEVGCAVTVIPLPNVNSIILSKVIEYCKIHVLVAAERQSPFTARSVAAERYLKRWISDFVMLDQDTLNDLFLAARFLHIEGLMDLTHRTLVDMERKTTEEIRETFNIEDLFTPEVAEKIRRVCQLAWEPQEVQREVQEEMQLEMRCDIFIQKFREEMLEELLQWERVLDREWDMKLVMDR